MLQWVTVKRRVVLCDTGGCLVYCCVATWMSSKQRHSKCSKWPPSAWIYASSLFRRWLIASSTTFSTSCNSCLSRIGTTSCPKCSNQPGLGHNCSLAMSRLMNWGVSQRKSSIISRGRCAGLHAGGGWQTGPQQCCGSLATPVASATRLHSTVNSCD